MTHQEFEAMVTFYGQKNQVFVPTSQGLLAWIEHAGSDCDKCRQAWYNHPMPKGKLPRKLRKKARSKEPSWARFTFLLAACLFDSDGLTLTLGFGPALMRARKKEIIRLRHRTRRATARRKPA